MTDLVIDDVDTVNIKVACERSLAKELSDFFTFKVPGHKYMPAFRNRLWDGQIKLYNIYKQEIYSGLYDYVLKFAADRNYSVKDNTKSVGEPVTLDQVKDFLTSLNLSVNGKPIEVHPHQLESIHYSITNGKCLLLSPTGSGKSLIIYALVRWYLNKLPKDRKVLILVPTISLVSQMYSDFVDYSKQDKFDVHRTCHKIYGGQDKDTPKRVVISTWQSIYKMPNKFYEQFGAVFGDECHLFKSKSLTAIMTKLKTCPYRIGTTGTLDGTLTHKLVIEGLFGRSYKVTSTKELMDKNILSNLSIDCLLLKYPDEIRQQLNKITYQEEIGWFSINQEMNLFAILHLTSKEILLFYFNLWKSMAKNLKKCLTNLTRTIKYFLFTVERKWKIGKRFVKLQRKKKMLSSLLRMEPFRRVFLFVVFTILYFRPHQKVEYEYCRVSEDN